MSIISRWILMSGIILAIHSSASAQSVAPPVPPPAWPVTSSPARFILEPDQRECPLPSSAELYLPDPKWADMPIRVFTDTGLAVGSDLLWTAPGEPATLLFDATSGAKHYQVYLGSNWPVMHLPNAKAGVLLEVRGGDGKVINNLPDMLQAWNQSHQVLGRALVTGIFEGGNRFGPQVNLFEHFQGWFDAAAPEHLELALLSTDASFVLVDGKEVVEWPGLHDRWYRPADGPPQGAIDLPAGPHLLDYYNAYVASEAGIPVTCTLTVKGGPFDKWTPLLPNNTFFRPVTHAHIEFYELQANAPGASTLGNVPALAIKWVNREQSLIGPDLPDLGLISMELTCFTPATGTPTWTFDDGSTAQGRIILHLFPRPGMRTVRLSIDDGGKQAASLTQTISVHPDWSHPRDPRLLPEHEADIMARDPATLSTSDLAGCFAVFGSYGQPDALLKFLPAVCTKMKEISAADLPYMKDAALFLAREDWAHSAEEAQLLRALIDRLASAQSSPQLISAGAECRLALARLLLRTSDKTDEAHSLLDAIQASALSANEPRELAILRADLALATGDVAGARKQYATLTGDPSGPDVRSSIRRTARIGQARAFLDRKDFEAAEDTLNEVAWQSPIDKISSDWALTRLRLYQEQDLPAPAYLWAKRLLPVITESGRSELLFRLTGLALAQGDSDLARKTFSELLQKHPYSQEAAEAKEKWPGLE